jgi:hypothetical protein
MLTLEWVGLFILLLAAVVTPIELLPPTVGDGDTVLRPYNILDFETATGLRRRNEVPELMSFLKPKKIAHLVYAAVVETDKLLVANMTLHMPQGVITLETVQAYMESVDCNCTDGELHIKWASEEAFNHIHNTQLWVNEDRNSTFAIITNHKGCGPDDERQVYWLVLL